MEQKPTSKARQKAVQKYVSNNYDRVVLTMPKGERDVIKSAAERSGLSLNAYIMETVRDRLENEGYNEI